MKLNEIERNSLELLKYALNQDSYGKYETTSEDYIHIFHELQQHCVSALVAPCFPNILNVPEKVHFQWELNILQQIYKYTIYIEEQKLVIKCLKENGIPFAILKGTSASCYYPYPQYRAMGDIDIIVRREDIEKACGALEEYGYRKLVIPNDFGRTIKYVDEIIEIEIHKYFASLNDPQKAEYLDNLILENIQEEETKLPDNINGLILLEHIGDHLEHGLGLRQIIDWMMYVQRCLGDKEWEDWFKEETIKVGLDKLAMVVTRMCQIYLGLDDNIRWCKEADTKLCHELMAYIMSSGNFGRKVTKDRREVVEAMTNNYGVFQMLKLLQKYGETNWPLLKRYSILKPFAWIYQSFHSIKKRINNKISVQEVVMEYRESKARKKLFDSLGVKQYAKGLAVRNGDHFEVRKRIE